MHGRPVQVHFTHFLCPVPYLLYLFLHFYTLCLRLQPHPSRMPPTSYPPYVSRDPYNRYAYANQYHEAPIRTSRPGGQTWVPKVGDVPDTPQ
jgi:hypothetical protein